ncbi:hypothetical protein A2U01_0116560, partial [Trifolium medium]|nr:hypothetical protein [Trifolium medium]
MDEFISGYEDSDGEVPTEEKLLLRNRGKYKATSPIGSGNGLNMYFNPG